MLGQEVNGNDNRQTQSWHPSLRSAPASVPRKVVGPFDRHRDSTAGLRAPVADVKYAHHAASAGAQGPCRQDTRWEVL